MVHHFETSQWIAVPVEQVFGFFADPQNLPRLMPAWQQAEIMDARIVPPPDATPPPSESGPWNVPYSSNGSSGEMLTAGPGSRMLIRFRPVPGLPLRLSWLAKITGFGWNSHFCDEQLRGPFAYWRHSHRVRTEVRNNVAGTLVRDHLTYELPLGWVGEIGHMLFARRAIAAIFRRRQQMLEKLLS